MNAYNKSLELKTAPTLPTVVKVCEAALQRMREANITGARRRADAVLHYLTGAATCAQVTGDEKLTSQLATIAWLVSIRGAAEVDLLVEEHGEHGASIAAARRYAKFYKRPWKIKLREHWQNESQFPPRDKADAPLLRALRNTLGPDWLASVKL